MLFNRFVSTILLLFIVFVLTSCQKELNGTLNKNDYIETRPPVLQSNQIMVNNAVRGFYSALPVHYHETTKKYPLLIFLHGGGQIGNGSTDLPLVLNEAVPRLLNQSAFPPSFKVNGQHFSFIILAPQFSYHPSLEEVESFITYAVNHYRIDKQRIYMSGLSLGGIITAEMGARNTNRLAAIVPISGVSNDHKDTMVTKCKNVAAGKLPVWVFQNDNDNTADVIRAKLYISVINSFQPVIAPKFTQFISSGSNKHDAWTRATDPKYRENNLNIYEWMLHYSR